MVLSLFKLKWLTNLQDPLQSFAGKTIIVTGASSGLGLEAAKKLAALNTSHLILAVRDEARGRKAKESIEQEIRAKNVDKDFHQSSKIETWMVDMSNYDSVIDFAKKVNTELPRLDGAILNAGLIKAKPMKSKYGWEETLQVNTLSTVLLALLLLPKLKATKSSSDTPVLQLIFSSMYSRQHFPTIEQQKEAGGLLQSFNGPWESFKPFDQYGQSKLLMMYAIVHLANQVSSKDVIINFVSPGIVATELARELDVPMAYLIKPIFSFAFQRSAEQGSRSYISGLLQGANSHGKLWHHDDLKDFIPNQIKDEQGNEISAIVWKAILDCLQKDIKNDQLQHAVQSLQKP